MLGALVQLAVLLMDLKNEDNSTTYGKLGAYIIISGNLYFLVITVQLFLPYKIYPLRNNKAF